MREEKYFIGSNGDAPLQLYFSKDDAFDDDHRYVDSFDVNGKRVAVYKHGGYGILHNYELVEELDE